jgi:hypothetical protein
MTYRRCCDTTGGLPQDEVLRRRRHGVVDVTRMHRRKMMAVRVRILLSRIRNAEED